MNPGANQNASNVPLSAPGPNAPNANRPPLAPSTPVTSSGAAPSAPITAPPAGGGMKSTLKLAVPLIALVGVVFGITFLTINAPKDPTVVGPPGINNPGGVGEPPLRFFSSGRGWDPPSLNGEFREFPMLAPTAGTKIDPTSWWRREWEPIEVREWPFSLQNRLFQGVYEQDAQTVRGAQFWFENRNPNPVTLRLKGVSCAKCSQGTLIAIPPEVTRNLLHRTALAALPVGAFNPFGVGLARSLAELKELPRESKSFQDDPNATFQIPAAANADGWSPQWGILELGFKVRGDPGPQQPLRAIFAAQVDGTERISEPDLAVALEVAHPCEVWPATLDVGRLDQLSTDKTLEFFVVSPTRGPGSEFGELVLSEKDIAAQGLRGAFDPTGFVEIAKVERVPEADLADLALKLEEKRKRSARVRSAYRVTAVLHPKVGDKRLEIGEINRTITVTKDGDHQVVRLKGVVRGAVSLDDDRNDIELAVFKRGDGTKQDVNLWVDEAGSELTVVAEESTKYKYAYELLRQPDRGGRAYYKLRITVKAWENPATEDVVLEVKGPNPQRIRIPVRTKVE